MSRFHRLAALLLVCLGFAAFDCRAEIVGGLHIATAHFGAALKAETPGLYVRHHSGATGGCYSNSYERTSCYVGWTAETSGRALALTVGAVTGYPARKVMPLLVPSARIPLEGFALRVAYIPKPVKHGTASGLHLSAEMEF